MMVLKKKRFVPGLTLRRTSILMKSAPSWTVYEDSENDMSSVGCEGGRSDEANRGGDSKMEK